LKDTSDTTKVKKNKYTHPVTGDSIKLSEHLSWKVQEIVRRWAFILTITAVTFLCWSTQNAHILMWWNFGASWMALVIESVVGIAMFQQTKADAKVIRKILSLEHEQFDELKELVLTVQDEFDEPEPDLPLNIETNRMVAELLARIDRLENPVVQYEQELPKGN